jgi:hydrogenase maturation protease
VAVVDALDRGLTVEAGLLSSHGIGLAEAIELGRLLDRLPRTLTIFGVEAKCFGQFEPVTPEVAAAIPNVVERVVPMLGLAVA